MKNQPTEKLPVSRRQFIKTSTALGAGTIVAGNSLLGSVSAATSGVTNVVDDFARADSLFHGSEWESLNPGYWKIENGALRRRLKNYGDRARRTGFPYHSETNQGKPMETDYDPSLPQGVLWRRDWKLKGNYRVAIKGTCRGVMPVVSPGDGADWKMYQAGNGFVGVAIGGKSLFESYGKERNATIVGWQDDATLTVLKEPATAKRNVGQSNGEKSTKKCGFVSVETRRYI